MWLSSALCGFVILGWNIPYPWALEMCSFQAPGCGQVWILRWALIPYCRLAWGSVSSPNGLELKTLLPCKSSEYRDYRCEPPCLSLSKFLHFKVLLYHTCVLRNFIKFPPCYSNWQVPGPSQEPQLSPLWLFHTFEYILKAKHLVPIPWACAFLYTPRNPQ